MKMAKRGYKAEYERKRMLEREGYNVYRVSGSIGAGDLLAVKRVRSITIYAQKYPLWKESAGFSVFIEQVKSVRGRVFYFDRKAKDEWRRLLREGIPSYFVVRFNHKNKVYWRRVKVQGEPPKKLVLEE